MKASRLIQVLNDLVMEAGEDLDVLITEWAEEDECTIIGEVYSSTLADSRKYIIIQG